MNINQTYVYAVVVVNGKEEAFNIKITEGQRQKLLTDFNYRNKFSERVRPHVYRALKLSGNEKQISFSMMPPEGRDYDKYLAVLKGLKPYIIESTTINMINELN